MSDDDRLVDGRTVVEVLAEDEKERVAQREREAAAAVERENAQFDAYLNLAFCVPLPKPEPAEKPKPDPISDPDLHGGARHDSNSQDADGAAVDAYVERYMPGFGAAR
jgi:hypothetical protein